MLGFSGLGIRRGYCLSLSREELRFKIFVSPRLKFESLAVKTIK